MSKVGDVIVRMLLKSEDYDKGLQNAKSSTADFAKAVSTGITGALGTFTAIAGAAVGVAKAIGEISQSSQVLADRWGAMTAGMASAWDTVVTSVGNLDLSSIIRDMKDASKAARELYNALDAMGEIGASYDIELARQQTRINELREELANTGLTPEARKQAGKELLSIYEELEKTPSAGLAQVSEKTIDKYLDKMGIKLRHYSKEQQAALREDFENFFVWLGTEQGAAMSARMAGTSTDPFEMNKTATYMRNQGVKDSYILMLSGYNRRMNDKGLAEVSKAITDNYNQQAKYSSETLRIRKQINAIDAQQNKKPGGGGGGGSAFASQGQQLAASLIDSVGIASAINYASDFGESLQKAIAPTIEVLSQEMPDLITEDWLKRQEERAAEMTDFWQGRLEMATQIVDGFQNAVIGGFTNSIDELASAVASGEGIDGGGMIKALLSPLADMCIEAGILIMTAGEGVEALRETFITGLASGGALSIAAGAALVAVGAAAKIGLAAIGSGKSAATGTTSATSSASTLTPQDYNTEITVHVEGKIKGSDIVLAGTSTQNAWNR